MTQEQINELRKLAEAEAKLAAEVEADDRIRPWRAGSDPGNHDHHRQNQRADLVEALDGLLVGWMA